MYDNSCMRREIGQYLKELGETGITARYMCQTRGTLLLFLDHCKTMNIRRTQHVSSQAVLSFLQRYEGMSFSHQRTTASILRMYLAALGNPAMLKLKLKFRGSARTRVDWLTPEETERVFQVPMTPVQSVLIGAGLLQGMRRIESLRLTVKDVKEALRTQNLRIRGKGNKERGIPLQEDFAVILKEYLTWTGDAEESRPLLEFARTRSEDHLAEFCGRFGRKFTFHTMRRTFGRNLWLLGVQVEVISEILGHSSTDMTRRYLGLNLTDMRRALSCYTVARTCTFPEKPVR